MSSKELIVVGGPNGAGKTTFALQYVEIHTLQFLSADAIAAEIAPENPAIARIAAGRVFLKRLELAIDGDQSLVVESTLSGRSLARLLNKAKRRGFHLRIVYMFLDSADYCVLRVQERARKGGHSVPEVDIRRRFHRSNENFWHLYRNLADRWALIYNSGNVPLEIASGSNQANVIYDAVRFAQFETFVV